ncbi:MAG: hypothetical protein PHC85_02975 [Candidatus Pacebacteria bacterium]|nr:hypothetical protein [Candidatus Paceibacterota bacterium]
MINPIQIKYAEEAFSKGASEADVRIKLKGEGLTDDEVSRIFSEAKGRKDFLSGNIASPSVANPAPGQPSSPVQPVFSRPTPPPAQPGAPVFQRPTPPPATQAPVFSQVPPRPQTPPPAVPPTPPPAPRPETKLQQDTQKIFQPLGGMGTPRLQTVSSGGKTFWLFALIFLLLIAAGAGYYFKDEIIGLFYSSTNVIEEDFGAYTPPENNFDQNQQAAEEEGTNEGLEVVGEITPAEQEQAAIDPNDAKAAVISQAKVFLASYYSQNGKYPTLEQFNAGFQLFQSDKDAFYCYRKEGTHYVVGTTLSDATKSVLQNDLDGTYACGAATKNCADPLYCVGPEN